MIHAHTHVVNHNYKNENILIEKLKFKIIDKFENILSNKNYIFYINPMNNQIRGVRWDHPNYDKIMEAGQKVYEEIYGETYVGG